MNKFYFDNYMDPSIPYIKIYIYIYIEGDHRVLIKERCKFPYIIYWIYYGSSLGQYSTTKLYCTPRMISIHTIQTQACALKEYDYVLQNDTSCP